MDWTEVVGFVTGGLCVWLTVRRSIWNFPVGIVNNVFFIVLFVGAGLYADAALQVVYIMLGLLGWFWWLRGGPDRTALRVRATPRWGWVAAVVATGILTLAVWSVLTSHTDSDVATWDALTTSLSLVAQVMLGLKWVGNWAFWIAADVVYVPLYLHKGLALTAVLYVGFLALCVVGLRQWRRAREDAVRPAPVPAREVAA
jgi:nicotinamide mononucleotide transporter